MNLNKYQILLLQAQALKVKICRYSQVKVWTLINSNLLTWMIQDSKVQIIRQVFNLQQTKILLQMQRQLLILLMPMEPHPQLLILVAIQLLISYLLIRPNLIRKKIQTKIRSNLLLMNSRKLLNNNESFYWRKWRSRNRRIKIRIRRRKCKNKHKHLNLDLNPSL